MSTGNPNDNEYAQLGIILFVAWCILYAAYLGIKSLIQWLAG